jgi:hypothetical protein
MPAKGKEEPFCFQPARTGAVHRKRESNMPQNCCLLLAVPNRCVCGFPALGCSWLSLTYRCAWHPPPSTYLARSSVLLAVPAVDCVPNRCVCVFPALACHDQMMRPNTGPSDGGGCGGTTRSSSRRQSAIAGKRGEGYARWIRCCWLRAFASHSLHVHAHRKKLIISHP